ncbi:hypothetical protein ABW21_db0204849 [Orbilia brochopaga]|nr:hypothetical protein ABW21_db0204849 [Drechslerella brochopaga]
MHCTHCCILKLVALASPAQRGVYFFGRQTAARRAGNRKPTACIASTNPISPQHKYFGVVIPPSTKLASNDLWETLLPTRLAALLQSRLATFSEHLSSELSHLQSHLPPSLRLADDIHLPVIVVTTILLALAIAPIPFLARPMRRFFRSVFDGGADDPASADDIVYVQHGRDTLTTTFPKGEIADSITTVGDLRAAVQDTLGLSRNHGIKLVFAGQNLIGEGAPLARYNIKHGAKVLCMASKSTLPPPPTTTTTASSRSATPTRPARPTPSISPAPEPVKKIVPPLEKIATVKQHVAETLMPLVESFENSPPTDVAKRKEEHHRLSETVLGEILKLDSVDVDGPDGAEVRKQRKATVKQLHAVLERLDKIDKESG